MTSAFSLHLREIAPLTKKQRSYHRHRDEQIRRVAYPDATTGTYAGRCAPPLAQKYSKCAKDQPRRAPAGRSASSISLVRVSQKAWNAEGRRGHTLTHLCMSPGADLRRSLHDLDLRRALHAPQLPNDRRERPPLRRGNDVHIRCDLPLPLLLLLDLGRRPTTRGACARSNT